MKLVNLSIILVLSMFLATHVRSQVNPSNLDRSNEVKEPQCGKQVALLIGTLYYYANPQEILDDYSKLESFINQNRDLFLSDSPIIQCMKEAGERLAYYRANSYYSQDEDRAYELALSMGANSEWADEISGNINSVSTFALGKELIWLSEVIPQGAEGYWYDFLNTGTVLRNQQVKIGEMMASVISFSPEAVKMYKSLLFDTQPYIPYQTAILVNLALADSPAHEADSDSDGVPDHIDDCPDIPGLVTHRGCPSPTEGKRDSDGDGISDTNDQCPNLHGLAQYNGCPNPGEFNGSPDSDGDGIEDNDDRCPNEAGPKELYGCPDLDGDTCITLEELGIGEDELHKFPWPPPESSDRIVLHSNLKPLQIFKDCQNIGCLTNIISKPLDVNNYSYSYYLISPVKKCIRGIVLVTMMEQFNKKDGSYLDSISRRKTDISYENLSFWEKLKALLVPREGYFRVLAFVITDLGFSSEGKITSGKARRLVIEGAPTIPKRIAETTITETYNFTITALVYEFKAEAPELKAREISGVLSAREHLQGAKLTEFLVE